MYKKWAQITGMITYFTIILIVTYSSTHTFNPIEVFQQDGILLKVVMVILAFFELFTFITFLWTNNLKDEICNKCGLNLLSYTDSHGKPTFCSYCKKWYHASCIKSDNGSVFNGCRQTGCKSA